MQELEKLMIGILGQQATTEFTNKLIALAKKDPVKFKSKVTLAKNLI